MSTVEEKSSFSLAERRRKKKEKRKAEKVIDSDSEPMKEPEAPIYVAQKKKRRR